MTGYCRDCGNTMCVCTVALPTELDRLLERNRRANDLKRGLERGIDHDELRLLAVAYLFAAALPKWMTG